MEVGMKTIRKNMYKLAGFIILVSLGVPGIVRADDVADFMKVIMQERQEAVVLTKTVVEMFDSERKMEGLATIISEEGLAVISLSGIDPGSFYRTGFDEVSVKDIKMVLADNTEIPSKIVLRDPELDLAFIKPLEPLDQKLTFVPLSEHTTPEMFDQVVILSRLGSAVGNVPSVSIARIQAVIEKPRTMFMPDPFTGLVSGMGTPVFSLDGHIIGILLLKFTRGSDDYSGDLGGISSLGLLPVILPAQEILDVMDKAPELKN